jgi:hypothetical protein
VATGGASCFAPLRIATEAERQVASGALASSVSKAGSEWIPTEPRCSRARFAREITLLSLRFVKPTSATSRPVRVGPDGVFPQGSTSTACICRLRDSRAGNCLATYTTVGRPAGQEESLEIGIPKLRSCQIDAEATDRVLPAQVG